MNKGWDDYAAWGIPAFVFVVLVLLAFGPALATNSMEQTVRILDALLTPVIAAIAVFIALQQRRIAQQQARTAERKLRLDTFDKRYVVFEALLVFISTVLGKVNVDPQDLYKYSQAAKGAYFLFGNEVQSYLDEVYEKAVRLKGIAGRLPGLRQEEVERLVSERETWILWFSAQYDGAKERFSKHMSLGFE